MDVICHTGHMPVKTYCDGPRPDRARRSLLAALLEGATLQRLEQRAVRSPIRGATRPSSKTTGRAPEPRLPAWRDRA